MEDPNEQIENEEDQQPTRKVRKFRVKKSTTQQSNTLAEITPIIEEEENKIPTKKKIIQIARKVKPRTQYDDPLKGSVEEDLLLEEKEDMTDFFSLEGFDGEYVVRYDSAGNILTFDESEDTVDQLSPDGKGRNIGRSMTQLQREAGLAILAHRTPAQKLEEKLAMIEEGKIQEEERQKAYEASLPPGARILMNRQNNILRKHEETVKQWDKMQNHMSTTLGIDASNLAINRSELYRQKIEEIDHMDRAQTTDELAGQNAWYMSLRNTRDNTNQREVYIQVGNMFSGLFTKMQERASSPEAIIRNPTNPKNNNKTFSDSKYFQDKKLKFSDRPQTKPDCCEIEDLIVHGTSKLEMELDAAHAVGLEKVDFAHEPQAEAAEEILEEHRDHLNLY